MTLHLKRVTNPYECIRCDISKKLIIYNHFYYEDDEDGLIVDADYYHRRKQQARVEKALLNPELNVPQDAMSYQTMMREKEREYLERGLLERPVAGKNYATKGGSK